LFTAVVLAVTGVILGDSPPADAVSAASGSSAQVSGRVVDADGVGIAGVEVNLLLEGSLANFSVPPSTTATDGTWAATSVAQGNYRVLFGNLNESNPEYRVEWHNNTYDPASSVPITVGPGVSVTGINATLAPNTQPTPPRAPVISVLDASSGAPTVRVTLPSTGPTAYGFSGGAGSCCEGDGIYGSVFDPSDFVPGYGYYQGRDTQLVVSPTHSVLTGTAPPCKSYSSSGAGPVFAAPR